MILWCRKCSKPMEYKYNGPLHMSMAAVITCGQCSIHNPREPR